MEEKIIPLPPIRQKLKPVIGPMLDSFTPEQMRQFREDVAASFNEPIRKELIPSRERRYYYQDFMDRVRERMKI